MPAADVCPLLASAPLLLDSQSGAEHWSCVALLHLCSSGSMRACIWWVPHRYAHLQTCMNSPRWRAAVLSARLGTGKGGVRMAPDELITSVLQVGSEWQVKSVAR